MYYDTAMTTSDVSSTHRRPDESSYIPDPAGRPIEDVRAIRHGIEAHVRRDTCDLLVRQESA